jgi:hypothetical protein
MLPALAARYLINRRNDKLGFADSIYKAALQQTGSRAVAAALTAIARQESDFNWRGDNNNKGGGNHGIFNVSTGVWNQWRDAGVNVKDPGAQVAAYLKQLQSVSPDTYRTILSARDPQSVLGAIQQDTNFHFGTYSSNQKVQRRVLKNADDFGKRFGGSTQESVMPVAAPSNLAAEQRQAGAGAAQFSAPRITNDNLPPPMQRSSDVARSEQIAPRSASLPWSTPAPSATPFIPHEDIPFAAPQMPDNIPAYEPQTYNPEQGYDIGGGFPASQGVPAYLNPEVQDQGFSVPMSYGYGSDFSAVPEGSYVPTADLSLASTYPVADLSQQQGDVSASVGGDDIARFGGDLTLGGDVPSADYAYMGMPGDYGGDPAAQDFYAANDQYGEGGWYYDAQGNIVQNDPFGGSYADASGAHDQQQQAGSPLTSSGGIADAPHTGEIFASTQVDPNTGRISTFDPTTGGYAPVSGPGGWTTTGYGAGSAYGAGWAGSGGAGFGGYGGLGGSGAPQFWSSSGGVDTSTAGGLSHGGSDPSGSRPGGGFLHATAAQRESAGTMGDLKLQHFASKSGFGGDVDAYQAYQDQQSQQNDAAQQASLSGLGDPLDWKWHGTPGAGGFSQPKDTLHAGWDYNSGHTITPTAGHWQPIWSSQQQSLLQSAYGKDWKYFNPGASTGVASPKQPPQSSPPPEHLATGGAIDLTQWMKRKSGKVPGVDHGVDEVYSLLRPGEIVVNRSQMRGLKVGNSKLLRADQRKAIKQAKKAA